MAPATSPDEQISIGTGFVCLSRFEGIGGPSELSSLTGLRKVIDFQFAQLFSYWQRGVMASKLLMYQNGNGDACVLKYQLAV